MASPMRSNVNKYHTHTHTHTNITHTNITHTHKYHTHTHTHIRSRKLVLRNLFAGQAKRQTREQTWSRVGRRGWGELTLTCIP